MKPVLLSLFLICTLASYSQQYLDKKIIVTVADTTNLYQRVRVAFGKHDFNVKEDGDYSQVSTFSRQLKKTPGYCVGHAEISGNTVTITGRFGILRIDDWGDARDNTSWKNLVYMKSSRIWPLFEKVADELNGTKSYSK